MTIPKVDLTKPVLLPGQINPGEEKPTVTSIIKHPQGYTTDVAPVIPNSGKAMVEMNQEPLQSLLEYRADIKGLNHDIRTPLSSIFNVFNAVAVVSREFGQSQELEKFRNLYRTLITGNQLSTPDDLEGVAGKLKHLVTLAEQDGSPEQILSASKDYQSALVKQFKEELIPCIMNLVDEMKRDSIVDPSHAVKVSKNANFILDLLSNEAPKSFNPVGLVQESVEVLWGTTVPNQMTFFVDSTPFDKEIYMNEAVFKNVLVNLFRNAAKASEGKFRASEGAECVVSFAEDGNFVVIKVSDNGPGIPIDKREEIFKEGVSGTLGEGKSTEEVNDGSGRNEGIGLPSVRRAVERAGGSIHAEESESGGACFVIKLPIHSTPVEENKPTELQTVVSSSAVEGVQERRPSKTGSYKILIIDDNRDARDSMKMLFDLVLKNQHSIEVEVAGSVEEAMNKIQNSGFLPHLILADVNLGGGDYGPTIKPKLESPEINIQGVKVIAITGQGIDETRKSFGYLDGVLTKPVDSMDLCTNVIPKLIKEAIIE